MEDDDDAVDDVVEVVERPLTAAVAVEEDDDDEPDDDDVEASLDEILKERLVVPDEEEDDEEEVPDTDDRGDGTLKVLPKQPDEFVCQSCFLVKHPSQLADPKRQLCRDCVEEPPWRTGTSSSGPMDRRRPSWRCGTLPISPRPSAARLTIVTAYAPLPAAAADRRHRGARGPAVADHRRGRRR